MRAVGTFYDEHPEKHLLTRHRCPLIGEEAWPSVVGAGEEVYPTLWRHPQLRYVCLETYNSDGGEVPSGAMRDWHREVHIPYYMDASTMRRPRLKSERMRELAFVGPPGLTRCPTHAL